MPSMRPAVAKISLAIAGATIALAVALPAVGAPLRRAPIDASLTPQGVFVWNLDGLMRKLYGSRRPCWAGVAGGRCYPYVYTFIGNRRTAFQLEARPPAGAQCFQGSCTLGNFGLVKIAGKFVSCDPSGEWLGNGHGSSQIGDLYCTQATPPADARKTIPALPSPAVVAKSLTPFGHDLLELDALVNDSIDARTPCINDDEANIFVVGSAYCPGPLSTFETYTYTFLNAFSSTFKLESVTPSAAVHVVKTAAGISVNDYETFNGTFTFLRLRGKFISCGTGRWMGESSSAAGPTNTLHCARLQ